MYSVGTPLRVGEGSLRIVKNKSVAAIAPVSLHTGFAPEHLILLLMKEITPADPLRLLHPRKLMIRVLFIVVFRFEELPPASSLFVVVTILLLLTPLLVDGLGPVGSVSDPI
jgi:hypothetical protein